MSRTERNAWLARHLNVTHPRVTGTGNQPRAAATNASSGAVAPHRPERVLGQRAPASVLSREDITTLRTRSNEIMSAGVEHGSADLAHNAHVRVVGDYDTYEDAWRQAGGTGDPPRFGFIGRDGRPVTWGPQRAPQEYGAMMRARAAADAAAERQVDPHARTQPASSAPPPAGEDLGHAPTLQAPSRQNQPVSRGRANRGAAGQSATTGNAVPHRPEQVLGQRAPASVLSREDITALRIRSNEIMADGIERRSADLAHNAHVRVVGDYDTYEDAWRQAGGTGEPPRFGFIGRDGRPVTWGPQRAPQEYGAMMRARAAADAAAEPATAPRVQGGTPVDPFARTQPAADPHARTQPALDPHAPVVEVEAPTSGLRRVAGGVARAARVAAGVGGAALNLRQAHQGINQVREATRQGTPEAINQGTEGVMNTGAGVLGAAGDVAGLVGAESVAAAAGSAAVPLAAAATVIAADRAGNAQAREAGVLGGRAGTTRRRGVASAGGEPEDPAEDAFNQDFDDAAIQAGQQVQQATGSEIAGAAAAGATRAATIPVSVAYGVASAAGVAPRRTDFSDIQARDEQERGVPLEQATPQVRERRTRIRARQSRERGQQARAAEAEAQVRDQQTRTTHIAAGTAITEAMVQARAQAILRRWALQRGQVAASIDLNEMERAERTAREELELERAGIH